LTVALAILVYLFGDIFICVLILSCLMHKTQAQDELRNHRDKLIRQVSRQPTYSKAQEVRLKSILTEMNSAQ
jgi:hypothetical protein